MDNTIQYILPQNMGWRLGSDSYFWYKHKSIAAFDCPNETNVMILNYPGEIGFQGDFKISKANVKARRPKRDKRKQKKMNMGQ